MPKSYREKTRDVPVAREADILVVGGGTAGVPAALAAARRGKKTLLVEYFSFLGGSATAALVTPLMHNGIKGNPSPSSINTEINRRMREIGAGGVDAGGGDGWFDPLLLSFVLEQMALESNVGILFNTFFSDVICEKGILKGVIIENKGGRQALFAQRVIDATGDADVAFRSGCPCESGRPRTHVNQPASLRFEVGGIHTERFRNFLGSLGQKTEMDFPFFHTAMVWGKNWPLEPIFRKAVKAGDLEERDGKYFQAFGIPGKPSCLAFNCPELDPGVDVTQPDYQSRSLIQGRQAILRSFRFMKKYFPGFEHAFLTQVAVMLGIRESRRIKGEYVLTGEDILNYKKFDDAIARSNYPVDIHGALDEYADFKRPDLPENERYYEVPYRSLVPKNMENLLVAGRCLSADFAGQSSPRVQPSCRAFGEAAGIASALSLDKGVSPGKVNGSEIRSIMRDLGAFL
jgi:hypothetical protein